MNILHYDHLVQAARQQPEPQQLLLVFARVELPDDSSPAQRDRFEAGEGGALVPSLCVARSPEEGASLAGLLAEADALDAPWSLMIAAALAGRQGQAPDDAAVNRAMEQLVARVQAGALDGLLVFDRQGDVLALSAS